LNSEGKADVIMKKKQAVITGLGIVASLGSDPRSFWENILNGVSGISRVTRFDPSPFASGVAGEIRDTSWEKGLLPKEKKMDRTAQYALVAAKQALDDSGMDLDQEDRSRCGVILGSARGAVGLLEDFYSVFLTGGPSRVKPHASPYTTLSSMSAAVARRFGLRGFNLAVSATCASSNHALGLALEKIQLGKADMILAGGSESCLTPFHFAQFCQAGILASGGTGDPAAACKPFDLRRDGLVAAEGAGMALVEEREHARKRGAMAYARLAGFGSSCDAMGVTSMPKGGPGLQKAMGLALKDAGLGKREVDYINAHGTGTRVNDRVESAAVREFFGALADGIPVSSTKSMTGHAIGASGAMEAIICCMAIRQGKIPPTINYSTPDPDCDLDYVPNRFRDLPVRVALSNAMGLVDSIPVLCFKRYSA